MLLLFSPFRRFSVQCSVTYMAELGLDARSTAGGHERG
jgi:hypothetical protein